ncbi:MAG TPA: hypothetical protein VFU43_27410 [Streptosporangiaceae bacterium]|nr:hypothetical protein [Streptosporangiaceae bacterium]
MPIGILHNAVVAAGYYHVGWSPRRCHFSVAARADVTVRPGSAAALSWAA